MAAVRGFGLGGDDEPAGILVEAVDDPRTAHAADPGKAAAAMGEQRVDQGSVGIARRWMDHQAGGLVDDDEMCILESDIERDRLGGRYRIIRVGDNYDKSLASADLERRIADHSSVVADLAGKDQLLEAGPRQLGPVAL